MLAGDYDGPVLKINKLEHNINVYSMGLITFPILV